MTKRTKRIFNGIDANMIATSHTLKSLFEDNISDFNTFDSSLNQDYVTEWSNKLEELSNLETDRSHQGSFRTLTEQIKSTMEACREMYKGLNYFAQRAFKGNAAAIMEFGKKNYPAARSNQVKMIELMQILHRICSKKEVALLAEGMQSSTLTNIQSLMDTLSAQNLEQESLKNQRRLLTELRVRALNECYTYLKTIMDAAKVIYSNDYAKHKSFLFGYSRKKKAVENEASADMEGYSNMLE